MKSLFEQSGGVYSVVGDYRLPNLTAPVVPEYQLGVWGRRRLDYLKHHRRVLYINPLTSGKLTEHLREIDTTACQRHETIIRQMVSVRGVTEKLKPENQMLWVGKMNNIRICANEIVLNEMIYN